MADPVCGTDETIAPKWLSLPADLLRLIVNPHSVSSDARLICRAFRVAFDSGVETICAALGPSWPGGTEVARRHSDLAARFNSCSTLSLTTDLYPDHEHVQLGIRVAGQLPNVVRLRLAVLPSPQRALLRTYVEEAGDAGGPAMACKFLRDELNASGVAFAGLQHLDLAGLLATNVAITDIATGLRAATHLTGLKSLVCPKRCICDAAALTATLRTSPHLSSLRRLDFSTTRLGNDGVASVAAALTAATYLVGLEDLALGSNLPEASAERAWRAVASMLRCARHLAALRALLFHCMATPGDGMTELAKALGDATHLVQLQRLQLRGDCEEEEDADADKGAVVLAQALQSARHLSTLQALRIKGFGIGAAGAAALACTLRTVSLRELDVSHNCLGSSGVQALAAALSACAHLSSLCRLDLGYSFTSAGDVGACAIADALRAAPHLSQLEQLLLTYNGIGARGAEALVAALSASPHLSGLRELSENRLGDESVAELRGALQAAAAHDSPPHALVADDVMRFT